MTFIIDKEPFEAFRKAALGCMAATRDTHGRKVAPDVPKHGADAVCRQALAMLFMLAGTSTDCFVIEEGTVLVHLDDKGAAHSIWPPAVKRGE